MKNTPKGLNEELMKMRKLMDFDISENSHDVLSEQNIGKSIIKEQGGGEPNWEWIKNELQKAKTIVNRDPECFQVGSADNRIKGVFEATVTEGSDAVNKFVTQLTENIKNNPNAQKYLDTGGKFVIESMDIIAGASNSLNGSVTPTMDNNYNSLNITKGSDEDKKYTHQIGSETYNKNMGYAKGRGEGVRDGLLSIFNSGKIKGFGMNPEKIKISNYIIDTGGEIDKNRDSNLNEGQVALVFMKVCWVNTEVTEIPAVIEEFKRCMGGISVQVNYDGTGHRCNNATFKIFANGVPLKRTGWGETSSADDSKNVSEYADLNNDSKDHEILNERPSGVSGGERYNEFKLGGEELGKIVSFDSLREYKGDLQIEAECIETSGNIRDGWFDKRKKVYYYENEENELTSSFIYHNKRNNEPNKRVWLYTKDGAIKFNSALLWIVQKYGKELCQKYGCDSNKISGNPSNYRYRIELKKVFEGKDIAKKLLKSKRNINLNRFGCHKGVASVKIIQNDTPVDTKNVSTPRYADNTKHNLGPIMEACNAKWNQLVDASKKVGEDQG